MLLETICIDKSIVINMDAHIVRMAKAGKHFDIKVPQLSNLVELLPSELGDKKVRCSITYDSKIIDIKFLEYIPRQISSLKLVTSDINYSHKMSDRAELNKLLKLKKNCDEVLIVKDGYITDTTYSNIVFENSEGLFTPTTFLLNGTKRQLLLDNGVINETEIRVNDLHKYQTAYLINAMLDVGVIGVDIDKIRL